jgi:periplasmic protein TonB
MKYVLLLLSLTAFLSSSAQDKNAFYAMDSNMNQTVMDSSKYILWIHEKEDSNWQWDYYYTWGPLIKSQSFADHDGTILNGRSCFYNRAGNIDSTGIFDHGKRNGTFFKFESFTTDSIASIKQYNYIEDSLAKFIDLQTVKDHIKISDTVNERESEYPGGMAAWYAYLQKNLGYPDRAGSKDIQGIVQIYFTVNAEGGIRETYIQKSVEYSLDQEALKVIKNSGKWIPSVQNGVNKKSYKVMPVNFKLE